MPSIDKDDMPEFAGGHKLITWAAYQCQPEWVRQLWMPQAYAMANEYSAYGDTIWTRREELGPFVELEDGTVPFSGMGVLRNRHHYDFMVDYWEAPFFEPVENVMRGYLQKVRAPLSEGRIDVAAKIMGAAGHYIEDMGVPAHAVDNQDLEFVRDFMDFPPGFSMYSLHAYTESSPPRFRINDYVPICRGKTPEAAGTAFLAPFVDLIVHARKLLFPLVKTAFTDDRAAADALRLRAAKKCAEVFADYLYTASCIGMNRFDGDGATELKLAECWPYRMTAWAPYPYTEMGPMGLKGVNLCVDPTGVGGRPVVRTRPCRLWVATGDGRLESRRFDEALGAGTYFEHHYRLSPKVYDRFTTTAGLHAELGAKHPVTLKVLADDRPVFEQTLPPDAPAVKIDVAVNGCRDLKLISSVDPYDPQTGSGNHVVWAEPRLR